MARCGGTLNSGDGSANYVIPDSAHQGMPEFICLFAENTKITTKIIKFYKLYFRNTRILYIILY